MLHCNILIYCLKCWKKTETNDFKDGVVKVVRPVKTGTCKVCRTKKRVFVKMDKPAAKETKAKKPSAKKTNAKK